MSAIEAGGDLRRLRDRVEALGGELLLISPAGGGTELRAQIPLGPWRTPGDPFLEQAAC